MIRKIEHSWYEYRQNISRLSPLIHSSTISLSSNWWYTSPIIQQTKITLCDSLKDSQLVDFISCEKINEFLLELINYCTYLPTILPLNPLTSVLMYDSIPKILNAEDVINKWLPVITNLSSNGVNFLFETYLKPEIVKRKEEISVYIGQQIDNNKVNEQLNKILRYISITMIIFFIILIILCIIIIVLYMHILISRVRWIKGQRQLYKILLVNKIVIKFIDVDLLLFLIISLSGVYLSMMSITEGCTYLQPNNLAQIKADELITKYIKTLIYNFKDAHNFLSIPNLNLQIPQNILQTMNSKYVQGNLPLLRSLHINRPFNFSIVLNSNFTY
ncbi:unnamed protein product [Heterobilharzia americana]|nr:unnamed protein product [Heterobilharzia americana]